MNKVNTLTIGDNQIELQKGVCGSCSITVEDMTFDLSVNLEVGEHAILTLEVSPQGEQSGKFEEVNISLCRAGEYNVSVFVEEPFFDLTNAKDAVNYLNMRKVVLTGVEFVVEFAHSEKDSVTKLLLNFLEMDEADALRQLEDQAKVEEADYNHVIGSMSLISSEMAEHFTKEILGATDEYDSNNGFRLALVMAHHEQRAIERFELYKSGGLYFVGKTVDSHYTSRQISEEQAVWYIKNTYSFKNNKA